MKCVFCEADSTGVLPKGIVCDKCNNYFARKVEGPFLGSDVIQMLRQELEIRTKNSRIFCDMR